VRGIVGIEIDVTRIEAKVKASQNRPVADRKGVVAGLAAEQGADGAAMSALVARFADAPE
ncbi:MAG: FMN-binding negative transcriptional regulator, partial [Hyphomicrobiaceae bacterium]